MLNLSEISKNIKGSIAEKELLSRHTTYRIGVPCDLFVEVVSLNELRYLLSVCATENLDFHIIGRGSNILVGDEGIKGIVIHLSGEFSEVSFPGGSSVIAGAGCSLGALIMKCASRGLGGIEFLMGIPGSVGGAAVMNAGTRNGCFKDAVKAVTLMDYSGKITRIPVSEISFGYRKADFSANTIVVSSEFYLKKEEKNVIIKKLREAAVLRRASQPAGCMNAGCVFRNPDGDYAGRLIETAGLKKLKIGGAEVSAVHANFINNTGSASAEDVLDVIRKVKGIVAAKFGRKLDLEIKIWGRVKREI